MSAPAALALRRRPSPKLTGYTGLAATALLAGLALGRPELVALGAPLALLVVVGLAMAREPELRLEVAVDRERVVSGDEATMTITVRSAAALPRLELLPVVPERLATPGQPKARSLKLAAAAPRTVRVDLRCRRWGAYLLGTVHLRAHDPLRLLAWEGRVDGHARLIVYPEPHALRALVHPFETQVFAGNQVSHQRGDGIEFADVRPFLPGDRARSINWRATARRGVPWVNERHPERNTDVVLFLDSFVDLGGDGPSTLDRAVGAAASLASAYLARRDRVGLVSFGGIVRWLQPGTGQAALYRLLDTLMETQILATVGWRGIRQLPSRTLPPKALIVALTPLVDERAVTALFDLLARGYDLAVVDVSPLLGPPGPAGQHAGRSRPHARRRDQMAPLAERLWALKREALRHRYMQLGAAVVEWRAAAELEQVLYEVEACRRRAVPTLG
ncbi:MAG TPA: DUF58 domain-containing protein [Actinomycetes bacterium]|nr:DUF58 domain-containing protein [Actinomycetes bacterium]